MCEGYEDISEDVRSRAEEEYHTMYMLARFFFASATNINVHKRMRKAHFTSIHDAIPYTLHQCEHIVILGVQHNLLKRSLPNISIPTYLLREFHHTSSACNRSIS